VVETTGVADPLPITLTFLGTELRDMTRLDSILTVIDAETFQTDLFNSQAAMSQIAYGDILLLNKTDLVSPERVAAVEAGVRTFREDVKILYTQHGRVPLPLIIDVKAGDRGLYQAVARADAEKAAHEHDHEHRLTPTTKLTTTGTITRPTITMGTITTMTIPTNITTTTPTTWITMASSPWLFAPTSPLPSKSFSSSSTITCQTNYFA
jgi:G3E family GTPase